jgi:hypothetical protein
MTKLLLHKPAILLTNKSMSGSGSICLIETRPLQSADMARVTCLSSDVMEPSHQFVQRDDVMLPHSTPATRTVNLKLAQITANDVFIFIDIISVLFQKFQMVVGNVPKHCVSFSLPGGKYMIHENEQLAVTVVVLNRMICLFVCTLTLLTYYDNMVTIVTFGRICKDTSFKTNKNNEWHLTPGRGQRLYEWWLILLRQRSVVKGASL